MKKSRTAAEARGWEELARLDPLWAVASTPQLRHGKWNTGDQSLLAGESFDLVYRGLVLQHPPSIATALACLERLCAAVGPGGVWSSRFRSGSGSTVHCEFGSVSTLLCGGPAYRPACSTAGRGFTR